MSNDVSGAWALFAQRGFLSDVEGAWVLVGVGVLCVFGAVYDFFSGHTFASYRDHYGLVHQITIDGEQNPIQFLIRVKITLLIGTALLAHGVWQLIG